ncbi:MAG: biopolymer transporter ExbD [Deltaproteobacteria bacterium]|nr:MAG: biopolymer transporter ExbD [Deltaproteobacteria bacterium]
MASRTPLDDDIITDINITPLVDIVLVLLIILMVTSNYISSQSIPMELPAASTAEAVPPEPLTVSIDADGQLFVQAEEATWEELSTRAQAFAESQSEPRAVIAADHSVSHGQFIRIVDLLREVGITRYAINVAARESENQGS